MGNTPSLEGEDKDKYIEEQKQIIREQQEQIQRLAGIAGGGQQVIAEPTKPKINPYKELNIGQNYDESSLKKAYLKRAMETHPDRGGTQEDFQRVTVSYKALMIKLKNERESHEHNELRENSSQFMSGQNHDNKQNVKYRDLSKNFNSNIFNQIYEETKVEDVYDDGYETWMKKNQVGEGEEEVQNNPSLTKDNFNREFSKIKKKQLKKKGRNVVKYQAPIEDISYKNKSSIMILGQGKVDDFSGESGGLAYRDYKDAYTNTYLVDEGGNLDPSRPKDLKETQKQRENISYEMDEKEQQIYALQKIKEEKEERLRLERLDNYEKKAFNIYDQVHQRMIGR
tara:strand:- start:697 stop:1716 length:1020 start_codon:yes stop_codon:yes gene_type:complete